MIGDAAGLVDPVSGDGMFEASSRGSSRPTPRSTSWPAGSGLEPYGERLTRQLGTHLWASWV